MESRIDTPRVAIVQERPGNAGWVEFVERFFPTACLAAEETDGLGGPGVIAPTDFLILSGRSTWVETCLRGLPQGEARAGLLVVLRNWSARIHAILRRGRTPRAADADAAYGMRRAERRLLDYLRASPGRIVTQSEILNNVFGGDRASGTSLVRVHVSRLRRRLGTSGALRTVRGAGYVLELQPRNDSGEGDLSESA